MNGKEINQNSNKIQQKERDKANYAARIERMEAAEKVKANYNSSKNGIS